MALSLAIAGLRVKMAQCCGRLRHVHLMQPLALGFNLA
jgi:hypothetical protein